MEDIVKKIAELREELMELKGAVAARKPIEDIVKYLLYFWFAISAVLGILGWTQLSDFDEQIKRSVANQFPEQSNNYKNYKKLLTDTETLYMNFGKLTKSYKERVDDLKYADVVARDFDIEGKMKEIHKEIESEKIQDLTWRAKAISVLKKLEDTMKDRVFPATFIFNAAQACRQLEQFQLAEDLTNAAFERDPSPPNHALKLSSAVSNKTGTERDTAYNKLMEMVVDLDYESSPQIVLSEAWNASESIRRYQPLIDAIDKLLNIGISSGSAIPSYAYVIMAQAILRQSRPGSADRARNLLERGYTVYEKESPLSQWNDAFRAEFLMLISAISEGGVSPELQELVK